MQSHHCITIKRNHLSHKTVFFWFVYHIRKHLFSFRENLRARIYGNEGDQWQEKPSNRHLDENSVVKTKQKIDFFHATKDSWIHTHRFVFVAAFKNKNQATKNMRTENKTKRKKRKLHNSGRKKKVFCNFFFVPRATTLKTL